MTEASNMYLMTDDKSTENLEEFHEVAAKVSVTFK